MKVRFSWQLIGGVVVGLMLGNAANGQQKPCSTTSKFGPTDQVGNVNYVTPEKTLAAAKLVTKGIRIRPLEIEVYETMP